MKTRHVIPLIALLVLGAAGSAFANHAVTRVDYAADRLLAAARTWQATTHYTEGRSRQAWLAEALARTARDFQEQVRYGGSFESLWVSWEVLATRFFEARELHHLVAAGHEYHYYGPAPLRHERAHNAAYYSTGYGHYGVSTAYQVTQESWRNLADAFYELREVVRYERDRYYARHRGYDYKYAGKYGARGGRLPSRYYGR